MAEERSRLFSETSFVEAVARRARVDLVLKPVTPSSEKRLISHFLGLGGDRLVLAVPEARGRKVFVPPGWDVGMLFPVAGFVLQARTTVLGHCQFPLGPARRVDGLVVQRPTKILAINRRKQTREAVDSSKTILTSVWLADGLTGPERRAAQIGWLRNRSSGGLGIEFLAPLGWETGAETIVRLEDAESGQCRIFRATLAHCTQMAGGNWLAGFGKVVELGPGEAIKVIESLAVTGTSRV